MLLKENISVNNAHSDHLEGVLPVLMKTKCISLNMMLSLTIRQAEEL